MPRAQAITPFNFTAISGNLPTSAAMMGNVVVWKPSKTQIYSAVVIMEVLQKAGECPACGPWQVSQLRVAVMQEFILFYFVLFVSLIPF